MPIINEKIFKAYDIRGTYPDQLNEDTAYWIGRAFGQLAEGHVVVGRDMRLSGSVLHAALVEGICDTGRDVVDIGLVPIDAMYFAVGMQKHPAGIMITASHNPKEYNGFKMALRGSDGMSWVRGVALRDSVLELSLRPQIRTAKPGKATELDVYPEYIKHVLSFCDLKKIKPLKVVVDAGNGMAGKVMPLLAPHLPIDVIPMNFTLDGNFPAHPSNPLLPESQEGIARAVKEHHADCGVIIDGDTDRLFFLDEQGAFIRADITLLLLARLFLQREPKAGIVYNVICSRTVPEMIVEWGGKPIRSKVGFANVSEAMRVDRAILGGELSAHYAFRENAYADSGFIALVILLQLLSEDGRKLSEIVKPFSKYAKSPEINLPIGNAQPVIAAIKQKYADAKQDELDGLTVSYPDWWCNVRPSNTEPLLRVTIEASDARQLADKQQEVTEFITSLTLV